MKRVALVSCSMEKNRPEAGGTLPARELYAASGLFREQLAEAESRCGALVYVVSAEHRLVELDQQLPWYDMAMTEVEDHGAWGRGVIGALEALHPGEALEVVVFAGAAYVDPIVTAMPMGWVLTEPLAGQTLPERRHTLRLWREARAGAAAMLVLPALAIRQPGGAVYSFGVDGKTVPSFAGLARIRRQEGVLMGYQRVESAVHISVIRRYLEGGAALVPNAVVIAFDERVRFAPSGDEPWPGAVQAGHLHIPLGTGEDWHLPGWVVDGQQRLAAVREAEVEALPLPACAFIGSEAMQAEHFIRVNSTKPLPKELITALLPHAASGLSPALEQRKLPATLVERLNESPESPLRGLIQTITNPAGVAKSTSFLNALEYSLRDGALYAMRDDADGMLRLLAAWWGAVQDTFPREWGKKPKDSRLFHGAGVVALSLLMDAVVDRLRGQDMAAPTREELGRELARVKDECRWSSGTWRFGTPWNTLQNTSQDRQKLAMFLATLYQERAKEAPRKRTRKQ